jgi:hypothetical protein
MLRIRKWTICLSIVWLVLGGGCAAKQGRKASWVSLPSPWATIKQNSAPLATAKPLVSANE